MKRWLVFGVLLLLGPGCVKTPPDPSANEEDASPSTQTASSNPTGEPLSGSAAVSLARGEWVLNQCKGIAGLSYVPVDALPAPPKGWQTDDGFPLSELRLRGFVCETVAIAGFERGPVSFTLEQYSNHSTPASCTEGEYDQAQLLSRIVVSDRDIAQYLDAEFGLPVEPGFGQWDEQTLGEIGALRTWNFGVEHQEGSSIGQAGARIEAGISRFVFRLFWANAFGGVSFVDMADENFLDLTDARAVTGTVNQPFLYAAIAPAYYAYGYTWHDGNLRATLREFGDLQCTQPLP